MRNQYVGNYYLVFDILQLLLKFLDVPSDVTDTIVHHTRLLRLRWSCKSWKVLSGIEVVVLPENEVIVSGIEVFVLQGLRWFCCQRLSWLCLE